MTRLCEIFLRSKHTTWKPVVSNGEISHLSYLREIQLPCRPSEVNGCESVAHAFATYEIGVKSVDSFTMSIETFSQILCGFVIISPLLSMYTVMRVWTRAYCVKFVLVSLKAELIIAHEPHTHTSGPLFVTTMLKARGPPPVRQSLDPVLYHPNPSHAQYQVRDLGSVFFIFREESHRYNVLKFWKEILSEVCCIW